MFELEGRCGMLGVWGRGAGGRGFSHSLVVLSMVVEVEADSCTESGINIDTLTSGRGVDLD